MWCLKLIFTLVVIYVDCTWSKFLFLNRNISILCVGFVAPKSDKFSRKSFYRKSLTCLTYSVSVCRKLHYFFLLFVKFQELNVSLFLLLTVAIAIVKIVEKEITVLCFSSDSLKKKKKPKLVNNGLNPSHSIFSSFCCEYLSHSYLSVAP